MTGAIRQYMKRKRARCDPGPPLKIVGAQHAAPLRDSDLANVLRLQPLWTLGDVELDVVTLGEAAEALRLDRCEVDEHVWTRLLRDKPKAFRVVEPLHLTLSHTVKTSAQWGTAPDWNDPRHRGVGRAQTKIRETLVLAERRQPVTVPRMLEPRAKVLTPPYPVNRDCRFVGRPLFRHHRNTSDPADCAITSNSL